MRKKKLIAIALLAGTMAVSAVAFTGCGGNYSETYEGTVSETSYTSTEDAAKGFVATELSGSQNTAEYQSYTKEKELSTTEIESLNISVDGTISSVEKGKITYKDSASSTSLYSASTAADEEEGVLLVTVYIVKYTPTGQSVATYKYYAPLPENGEALSYSYYSSVLDPSKYINCTVKAKSNASGSATYNGEKQSYSSTGTYTMKITEDAAYMKMKMTTSVSSTTVSCEVYFVETSQGLKCAGVLNNSAPTVIPVSSLGLDIGSIDDLYASQLTEEECSLFVKTDYGFMLREDALSSLMGESGASLYAKFDGNCKYYVTEGRIQKAVISLTASTSYEGTSTKMKMTQECAYSAFGTTTVEIPSDIQTLLGV